ncbi:MAG: DnaD domain protein [Anaerolineaceae bacterium]
MKKPSFGGFPAGKLHTIPVPEDFFTELLPEIDSLPELKVTLYALWHLDHQEGVNRRLLTEDFLGDDKFVEGFGTTRESREEAVRDGIERACLRGTLLRVEVGSTPIYFLNSERGRAAAEGLIKGAWTLSDQATGEISLEMVRPNIYNLYEKNIGPLTPILSQTLQEAEQLYPAEWIEEAIHTAVVKNARSWRYIEAILRSWKEKGRDEKDRRNHQEDGRKYIEGEYADFIEH